MNAKFIALGSVVVLGLVISAAIVFQIKGWVDEGKAQERQEALLIEQEKAGKGTVVIYASKPIDEGFILSFNVLEPRLLDQAEVPKNACHRREPIMGWIATREIKTGTIITTDAIKNH